MGDVWAKVSKVSTQNYQSSCLRGLDLENSIPYQLCRKPPNTPEMSEKNADMSGEMQQEAVACTTQALEKNNIEKDIAACIKKEFDKKYNPTRYAIVDCLLFLLTHFWTKE